MAHQIPRRKAMRMKGVGDVWNFRVLVQESTARRGVVLSLSKEVGLVWKR